MSVFQCSVLPFPQKASPRSFWIILHNFYQFFSCSPFRQPLEKALTSSISLIQTLLFSTWYLHPATSWPTKPSRTGIFSNDLVSWEVWPLQRRACFIKNYPCYISISVCLHMQPQIILRGSNFTYIPRSKKVLKIIIQYSKMWYANEPILIFSFSPRQFLMLKMVNMRQTINRKRPPSSMNKKEGPALV